MEETELMTNPIFGALTRPAMISGVTFEYHMLNLTLSMCALIGFGVLYGLMFIPLHLFGWLVCRYDIHFFKICYTRFLGLVQVPNQFIWGVRAYEPF